jgi:hypothetical protein
MAGVAWAMFFYQDDKDRINARYDNCPVECPENADKGLRAWNPARITNCDDCPHKRCMERFKENAGQVLEQRLGDKGKAYRFDHLLRTVRLVSGMEELSHTEISLKAYLMLDAYLIERYKYKRMKEPKPSA